MALEVISYAPDRRVKEYLLYLLDQNPFALVTIHLKKINPQKLKPRVF
jgi:hypothetical protein